MTILLFHLDLSNDESRSTSVATLCWRPVAVSESVNPVRLEPAGPSPIATEMVTEKSGLRATAFRPIDLSSGTTADSKVDWN
jgi:hypothetical protein